MIDIAKILTFFGGIFGIIFFIAYQLTSWQCAAYEDVTGKRTKHVGGACYIQSDGQWMHWEEYKLRHATKGADK